MRQALKAHGYFILFFGTLFAAFFWPLLSLKKVFIFGDNAVQFYPWAFHYAETLKAGGLPYWTTLMGGGFPLVAEGQVAPYYPLNLILYSLLPFKMAYAWTVPLHSLLGGIGFYWYALRLGLKKEGAALSAVLFSFSTAYGGCFYTMGTLQVLTWLPWGLLILERLAHLARKTSALLSVSALGLLGALMWTGGFPQAALYAYLYLGLVALFHEKRRASLFITLGLGGLLGLALALPQVLATLELAKVSVRQGESLGFALWGSVPPPALTSLLFPHWGIFFRVSFFLGVLPFFFVVSAIVLPKPKAVRLHLWLALFFLLLSLGKYNPLYTFAIESLSLTFLRNPAKFLFFSALSLTIAAGHGLDAALAGNFKAKVLARFKAVLVGCVLLAALLPLAAQIVIRTAEKPLADYGRRYAENVYHSKAEPLFALEDYQKRVSQLLGELHEQTSPMNARNVGAALFAMLSFFLLWPRTKGALPRKALLTAAFLLVSLDLYPFGLFVGHGFVGNAASDAVAPQTQQVIDKIRLWQERSGGRMAEWANPGAELLEPNASMRYSIAHAGAYSPLLLKRYYELTKDLGIVDSSLGRPKPSREVWRQQKKLLDLLGVDLVLSDAPLAIAGLKFAQSVNARHFYANTDALPLLFVVFEHKTIANKEERLNYLKSAAFEPSREAVLEEAPPIPSLRGKRFVAPVITERADEAVSARVTLDAAGVLVFRSAYYPRWKATVDGVEQRIVPVDHAFSGLFLERGSHQIRFTYDLRPHRNAEMFSLGLLLVLGLLNLARWKKMNAASWVVGVWVWGALGLYVLRVLLPKLGG